MDTTTAPIDTSVMPTIHTFFRREIRLAGGVIRRVADGDVRRAAVVADHLDFVARTLHEHHTAEDELLWPKLLDRVPEELAPIVRLMEAQHGQVDALLAEIGDLRPRWAATRRAGRPRPAGRALRPALRAPRRAPGRRGGAAAAHRRPSRHAGRVGGDGGARPQAARGKSELSLALGMFQYEGDPAVIAQMLAEAPAPVRWIVPRLSRRAFRRHALVIHGTATP